MKALARQHTTKAIETLVKALDNDQRCASAAAHLLERACPRPATANDLAEMPGDDTTFVPEIVGLPKSSVSGSHGMSRMITPPMPAYDDD